MLSQLGEPANYGSFSFNFGDNYNTANDPTKPMNSNGNHVTRAARKDNAEESGEANAKTASFHRLFENSKNVGSNIFVGKYWEMS